VPASNANLTRRLFDAGVIIKGIDGVIQTLAGALLLFDAGAIQTWIWVWISHRRPEQAGDLLARMLAKMAALLSTDTKTFAAYYLLGHGAVKVFLAVYLLRERMWAFPVSIAIFGLFVVYQLHRFTFTHSISLLGLALLDVVVIGLIWREWRLRAQGVPPPAPISLRRRSRAGA
jgi:uncharacterized membrane protein